MKESDHNSYVFFRDVVGEPTPEKKKLVDFGVILSGQPDKIPRKQECREIPW